MARPTNTGYWETQSGYVYYLDVRLADALLLFLRDPLNTPHDANASVMELGAGMGCYTDLLTAGGLSVSAYDGSRTIAEQTEGLVQTADLSQEQSLGSRADWVLCMEVAEHIPQQYEEALLSNMHRHNRKGIVLSWSNLKPPQGNGHVNPRSSQWVIGRFAGMGYFVDGPATQALRHAAQLPWFKANLLVMRRNVSLNEGGGRYSLNRSGFGASGVPA